LLGDLGEDVVTTPDLRRATLIILGFIVPTDYEAVSQAAGVSGNRWPPARAYPDQLDGNGWEVCSNGVVVVRFFRAPAHPRT